MARIPPLALLPPVLFAGIAAMFLWGMGRENPDDLPSALIERPAPALPQTTLEGTRQLTDADLRAPGVKLVNFWASWCPPCRAEHSTLTALAQSGLPVLGVDLKDPAPAAQRFLDEHGNPFGALATDPQGRAAIDWGVTAPPETFIVDAQGRILYRHAGPLVGADYENRFRPELEKALAAE